MTHTYGMISDTAQFCIYLLSLTSLEKQDKSMVHPVIARLIFLMSTSVGLFYAERLENWVHCFYFHFCIAISKGIFCTKFDWIRTFIKQIYLTHILPQRDRVDLGEMMLKIFTIHSRVPELESQNLMKFSFISRTSLLREVLPLVRG